MGEVRDAAGRFRPGHSGNVGGGVRSSAFRSELAEPGPRFTVASGEDETRLRLEPTGAPFYPPPTFGSHMTTRSRTGTDERPGRCSIGRCVATDTG
jgi:hypothetical protein